MKPHASAMSLPGLRVPAKNCGCRTLSQTLWARIDPLRKDTRGLSTKTSKRYCPRTVLTHDIGLKEPTKHSARCASYSSYRRVLVKKSHIKNYFRIKGCRSTYVWMSAQRMRTFQIHHDSVLEYGWPLSSTIRAPSTRIRYSAASPHVTGLSNIQLLHDKINTHDALRQVILLMLFNSHNLRPEQQFAAAATHRFYPTARVWFDWFCCKKIVNSMCLY
jgi:hypothetical protein